MVDGPEGPMRGGRLGESAKGGEGTPPAWEGAEGHMMGGNPFPPSISLSLNRGTGLRVRRLQ